MVVNLQATSRRRRSLRRLPAALWLTVVMTSAQAAATSEPDESIMTLATQLSAPEDLRAIPAKASEVLKSYIKAYGSIENAPKDWKALVRRTLVCDGVAQDQCVKSSLDALVLLGGAAKLPLDKMAEIDRFGMSRALLIAKLDTAKARFGTQQENASPPPFTLESVELPAVTVPAPIVAAATAVALQPDPALLSTKASQVSQPNNLVYLLFGAGLAIALLLIGAAALALSLSVGRKLKLKAERAIPIQPSPIVPEVPEVPDTPETAPEPAQIATQNSAVPMITDPKLMSAKRILDTLHQAEADVDAVIRFIGEIDSSSPIRQHFETIQEWRQAVIEGKHILLANLEEQLAEERHSRDAHFTIELPAVDEPKSLSEATSRLLNHSVFYASILHLQGKNDSAIFHWSKLLPDAVIRTHWHTQAIRFMTDLASKPLFDIPVKLARHSADDQLAESAHS